MLAEGRAPGFLARCPAWGVCEQPIISLSTGIWSRLSLSPKALVTESLGSRGGRGPSLQKLTWSRWCENRTLAWGPRHGGPLAVYALISLPLPPPARLRGSPRESHPGWGLHHRTAQFYEEEPVLWVGKEPPPGPCSPTGPGVEPRCGAPALSQSPLSGQSSPPPGQAGRPCSSGGPSGPSAHTCQAQGAGEVLPTGASLSPVPWAMLGAWEATSPLGALPPRV